MCWWDFRNRLGTAVSLLSVSWGDTFLIWVAGMPFLLCLVCKSLETFLAREFYSLFPAWSPSMSTWTFAYLMNPKSCPRSLLRVSMAWSWGCCTNRHRQYPESCSSGSEEHLRFRGTPSPHQLTFILPFAFDCSGLNMFLGSKGTFFSFLSPFLRCLSLHSSGTQ